MNEIDQKRALLAMCYGFVLSGIVLLVGILIQFHFMEESPTNTHEYKSQSGLIYENKTPDSIWIYKGYFNTNDYGNTK